LYLVCVTVCVSPIKIENSSKGRVKLSTVQNLSDLRASGLLPWVKSGDSNWDGPDFIDLGRELLTSEILISTLCGGHIIRANDRGVVRPHAFYFFTIPWCRLLEHNNHKLAVHAKHNQLIQSMLGKISI